MRTRLTVPIAACLFVVSCGAGDTGSDKNQAVAPISIGRDGTFYPESVPTGTMPAQDAYNAMRAQHHLSAKAIPDFVTPRYGLLDAALTHPRAVHMPVWAFTTHGCLTSNGAPAPDCTFWVFARASDGKDLSVGFPQNPS